MKNKENFCELKKQGFTPGCCETIYKGKEAPACQVTLKWEKDTPYRLIKSAHLSRPEHYFSIYQSGCNLSCKKCHSWEFTLYANGKWMSPKMIAELAREYADKVTYYEPRERATAFHALDLCRGCGLCVLTKTKERPSLCPGKIEPHQVVLSPQGFGPARNIVAFTGGDLACQVDFYAQCAELIKLLDKNLWVLFETNGYGLTPKNLDILRSAGVDSFWLDIKAWDENVHIWLTGVSNRWILKTPEEILKRGFVLEVLSLLIPGYVEKDQLIKIASLVKKVDSNIPFTILAFFPEHRMRNTRAPNLNEMLQAYYAVKETGLKNIRLANLGVFVRNEEDMQKLLESAPEAI